MYFYTIKIIVLVKGTKVIMFTFGIFPVAAGSLATGGIFGATNIGLARNPEESSALFNNSMIAFALVETFIFVGVVFCTAVATSN